MKHPVVHYELQASQAREELQTMGLESWGPGHSRPCILKHNCQLATYKQFKFLKSVPS